VQPCLARNFPNRQLRFIQSGRSSPLTSSALEIVHSFLRGCKWCSLS
jgi:hypothetical protein